MATNLRLHPEAEEAVRREAERTGRSQQEVMRAAIDQYLGRSPASPGRSELDLLVAAGVVRRPRSPYRRASTRFSLPDGVTSADALDRDDRI